MHMKNDENIILKYAYAYFPTIKKLEGTTYVLEVVERLSPGKYKHVGYMQSKFTTIQDACQYYDKHNLHMRKLNALKTFKSD